MLPAAGQPAPASIDMGCAHWGGYRRARFCKCAFFKNGQKMSAAKCCQPYRARDTSLPRRPCLKAELFGGSRGSQGGQVDILCPRWVARIGVTRSTQACFLGGRSLGGVPWVGAYSPRPGAAIALVCHP